MFIDSKKAYLDATFDEEKMGRTAGRIQEVWKVRQAVEMASEKGSIRMGGRLRMETGE